MEKIEGNCWKTAATLALLSAAQLFQGNEAKAEEFSPPASVNRLTPPQQLALPPRVPKIPVETNYHGEVLVDNYRWLEPVPSPDGQEMVSSPEAMEFVKMQNSRFKQAYEGERFEALKKLLTERNGEDPRMPTIGDSIVFQHRDSDANPKGLLRICDRESYLRLKDNAPFVTVLDIDKLSQDENTSWILDEVLHKAGMGERCLVGLSYGGTDKVLMREFDLREKRFVEGGFRLEGKTSCAYLGNSNTVLFATATDETNTSASGYPLEIKIWDRSTTVENAPTLFRAERDHMLVGAYKQEYSPGKYGVLVTDAKSFFQQDLYLVTEERPTLQKLPLPTAVDVLEVKDGFLLFRPNESYLLNGQEYKGGIVALDLGKFLSHGEKDLRGIYQASTTQSVSAVALHDGELYIAYTENVIAGLMKSRLSHDDEPAEQRWATVGLPGKGSIASMFSVPGVGVEVSYEDFLTPSSTYFVGAHDATLPAPFLQDKARFDTAGAKVTQEWAVSADGTRVPFFVVNPHKSDGPAPTMLNGYGGFQVSMTPEYNWPIGALWLEKGGVYVVANIRGGGEFGPEWHQAALKENRNKAYEDFIAVGERLIELGITTKDQLGITGGSNGGLLMGNMLTMRPDLFKAIDCRVPLLDMLRFHELPPGDSWTAEYGNSDNAADFQWLKRYSAYHNIKEGVDYPPVLFTTSSADDRVNAAHARKSIAKMIEFGNEDAFFFEETEGGHGKRDFSSWIPTYARRYAFLSKHLGLSE